MIRRMIFSSCLLISLSGLLANPGLPAQSGRNTFNLGAGEKGRIQVTVITDNVAFAPGTKPDWGFSCLIEGTEKTVLFDTGAKPDLFLHNVEQLRIDLKKVQQVVISHDHDDHTGGLAPLLEQNPSAQVFLLSGFAPHLASGVQRAGAAGVTVDRAQEISRNVFLTGVLGDQIKEQAVVLNSDQGLVVFTGCSHPGIVMMLERIKETFGRNILLVAGGFHLLQHKEAEVRQIIARFLEMGIIYCGATHCTGERPIAMFKEAYGPRFVPLGAGRVLQISADGIR